MIATTLARAIEGQRLTRDEMAAAVAQMLEGSATPVQMGALLAVLRARGETVEELIGAVQAVRAQAQTLKVSRGPLVDTCGTGGDGAGTFNISTAAALVAASCGVVVAKHGNRSVSSRCGSADVLAALGANVELPPERVAACIEAVGLGFLFAPAHHPTFRHLAGVRRELGVKTLFNLVGPLANPASALRQVMGVFSAAWVPLVAEALAQLGVEHAWVVHGQGMDELSVSGESVVVEVRGGTQRALVVTPESVGLPRSEASALAGGSAEENAAIIRAVLAGEPGPRRDVVVLNAGAALLVAGKVETLREGVERAREAIDLGAAERLLHHFVRFTQGTFTTLDAIVAGAQPEALQTPSAAAESGGPDLRADAQPPQTPSAAAQLPEPGLHAGAQRHAATPVLAPAHEVPPADATAGMGESSALPASAVRRSTPVRVEPCPGPWLEGPAVDVATLLAGGRPTGPFFSALSATGGAGPLRVIAEVKRASPSAGTLAAIADPVALARRYAEAGAAAISVLTEPNHFHGSLEDLRAVSAAGLAPTLRKDFVTHPDQLLNARRFGASAALLIAAVLGRRLRLFVEAAAALGVEALVEVHDAQELELALEAGATLIGINHRDLRTFEIDLSLSARLLPRIPPHVRVVAESGVRTLDDARRLRDAGLRNLLIGEALVRSDDPGTFLRQLGALR